MLNYIVHEDYDKHLQIEQLGELLYFSKKKMREKYPKAGYIIVGAIGKGVHEQAGNFKVGARSFAYYTLHFEKMRYEIAGYIDCGNEQYLAIVKPATYRNMIGIATFVIAMAAVVWFVQSTMIEHVLDPNAKSYTPSVEHNVVTDPDHIALPGYDDIRMEAGSDIAYLALWNPEGNPCLFKFTLLKDGEQLYQSGMIEPGKAVTEVKLSQSIAKGVHDATLKIQTYAIDDPEIELNGGEVLIKLVGLEKEE